MTCHPVKVSIVIPVYNIGATIGSTLESIFAQTEPSFEIICVNDGSTDNGETLAILNSYAAKDSRVRVITQKNGGPETARTHGLSLAQGKFVYVCDQDDLLHPQLLEYCLWVAETYHVEFVAFRYRPFHGDIPHIDSLPQNFASIPLLVADDNIRKTSPTTYLNTHKFHIDSWVQFSSTELARKVPFTVGTSLSRPFALIKRASRWARSTAILYFYNDNQQTSMSHRTISLAGVEDLRKEAQAFFDVYADERANGDPIGLWAQQCRGYLIKRIKITYNAIQRGKSLTREERRLRLQLFTTILYEFFIKKKVPFHYVAFRHKLPYILLLIRFYSICKKREASCIKASRK